MVKVAFKAVVGKRREKIQALSGLELMTQQTAAPLRYANSVCISSMRHLLESAKVKEFLSERPAQCDKKPETT